MCLAVPGRVIEINDKDMLKMAKVDFSIFLPPAAQDVEFDNSTNGFDSDNVQSAVEEAKEEAAGFFEKLEVQAQDTTTSNGWTTMDGWPQTFPTIREADKQVIINYTANVGQSDKEKAVGSRVQWRVVGSGGWNTIPGSDIRNGVSEDNQFELRTSFNTVTPNTTGQIQVRWQFGQTDNGGTGRIRNALVTIANVVGS